MDTIDQLPVVRFHILNIWLLALHEIHRISVTKLPLKDAGSSSFRIRSDPRSLCEMAWFSQSQLLFYYYNLCGYFLYGDEVFVP